MYSGGGSSEKDDEKYSNVGGDASSNHGSNKFMTKPKKKKGPAKTPKASSLGGPKLPSRLARKAESGAVKRGAARLAEPCLFPRGYRWFGGLPNMISIANAHTPSVIAGPSSPALRTAQDAAYARGKCAAAYSR